VANAGRRQTVRDALCEVLRRYDGEPDYPLSHYADTAQALMGVVADALVGWGEEADADRTAPFGGTALRWASGEFARQHAPMPERASDDASSQTPAGGAA
jgi:hypothetical protein